jgi:hypothetical protein
MMLQLLQNLWAGTGETFILLHGLELIISLRKEELMTRGGNKTDRDLFSDVSLPRRDPRNLTDE